MWQLFVIVMVSLVSGTLWAAEIEDATGRRIAVPDRVERVMAAGPPATVVLYVLAPEKMIGWTAPPRPDEKPFLLPAVRDLPELGRLTGVQTPVVDAVLALIQERGRAAGLYT